MGERLGIVLAAPDCTNSDRNTRAYVLDVDFLLSTGLTIALPVDDMAFRLPTDAQNMEVSLRKNQERRLGRPLNFGDCISWHESDCIENRNGHKTITRFDRQNKLFPVRIHYGVGQLLMEGIINPKAPENLYTEFIHAIPIPKDKQKDAWPNIYYTVWIGFKCNELGDVGIEFGSFHGLCVPDKQIDVSAAPWNRDSHIYTAVAPPDDSSDDEFGGFGHLIANPRKKDDTPSLELFGREATLTGERTMIIWELPNHKVVLPFKSRNLEQGWLYSVNVYWNVYEKMYMVSKIHRLRRNEAIKTTPSGQIRISVKAAENIRGIFENTEFGLLDDPNGILNVFHLCGYALNSIPVIITDRFPSRGGQIRFSIADIHGEKKAKYELWKNEKLPMILLEKVTGFVVDGDRVFSAAHYPNFFRFHISDNPPAVGSRVIFSAKYNSENNEFEIIDWRVDQYSQPIRNVTRKMNRKSANSKQSVFYVKGRIPVHAKLTQILVCSEFGLIDDNLELIKFDKGNTRGKEYRVWVSEAHGGDCLQARTVFHVVGINENPPDDRVEVEQPLSAEEIEMQKEFRNIVQETIEEQQRNSARIASREPSTNGFGKVPHENIAQQVTGINPPGNIDQYGFGRMPQRNTYASDRESFSSFKSDTTFRPPSECSTVFSNSQMDYARADASGMFDDSSSMLTINGGIDPAVHIRESRKREVQSYTGPVKMPPGSSQKFNVVETLSRLKYNVKHSPSCGIQCAHYCPWLAAIAMLVVAVNGFWEETQKYYPQIASVLMKCINNLNGNDS